MAQLSSPGVSVTVVDESFYTPAAPGTVPLIIVVSEQDKMNSAGTGTAPGTTKANAGNVYLLTSQADLGATFGTPYFQTDSSNNPVNAGELNEYGLQAAYSFLGVSNRAYVVRADVDTKQLIAATSAPTAPPADGTYWFDVADTNFGVFQWNASAATATNGQTFINQSSVNNLTVITDTNLLSGTTPRASYGSLGDYAIVSTTTLNKLWLKKYQTDTAAGTWVEVGTSAWSAAWPTVTSSSVTSGASITGTLIINGTTVTGASSSPSAFVGLINAVAITGVTAAYVNSTIQIYSTGVNVVLSGSITGTKLAPGTYGLVAGTYLAPQLQVSPHYAVPLYGTYDSFVAYGSGNAGQASLYGAPTGSVWVKTTSVNLGANWFVKKYNAATSTWIIQSTQLFANNQSAMAALDASGGGINIPVGAVYVKYNDGEYASPLANFKIYGRTGTGATNIVSSPITASTFPAVATGTASASGIISNGATTLAAGTVFTPTGTVTGTYAVNMVLTGSGVTAGTTISAINTATAITATTGATLTLSSTTTTSGNITIANFATYTLAAGMPVVIAGSTSQGISAGTYYIIGSPTSTAIQLSATKGGVAITTTVGAISGLTATLAVLNVTAVTGTLSVGQVLSGGAITAGTYINALIGGAGGAGTYALNQIATGAPTTATSYTVNTSQLVSSAVTITGTSYTSAYTFTIAQSQIGSTSLTTPVTVSFNATSATTDAQLFLSAFSAAVTDPKITATLNTSTNVITITHLAGGDMRLVDGTDSPLSKLFSVSTTSNFYTDPTSNGSDGKYIATQWASTVAGTGFAPASLLAPTTTPVDGTLWYDSNIDADIMINDGSKWVGYLNYTQNAVGGGTTDPQGPIISATMPTAQSGGLALANGDIWIDPQDLEEYPMIYKYNYLTKKWVLIDNTDQVTGAGIVFGDARWGIESASVPQTGTVAQASIATLLSSNFVDFDCPNPALYPKGMLLWNLRRSGFNVKRYVVGYVSTQAYNTIYNAQSPTLMTNYAPDRWVTYSPNDVNGVGQFGRKAQRSVVLQALNATIQANQNIRQPDTVIFNLLSCPGYLETTSELVALNNDNGLTAFIVADSPARLTPDATSLSNWGNNTGLAAVDGEDGLIATDPYTAVYYPWGYTTDLLGNNIVVPPSHIMLRTIALSDNVSYPWFAPAGVRRGGVTNASSVGYVDGMTGEFVTVALNVGQRDTLAAIHVNPITYIAGTGLVVYGQKTRQLIASSLDRINVARLVIYLRYQLNQLAKPFVFEPNDTITRNEIKQLVEKLMLELTAERALYDYLVVCDSSNNTPARIDRNELHVDIAIEPVKAVEFIYIPLRLENTGAIKGLGK